MPAKKVKKEAPETDHSTVELAADDSARDLLLPFLALGYSPVETSGVKAQCGLHALCLSWRSACEQAGKQDIPDYPTFRELLEGDMFKNLCEKRIEKLYKHGKPARTAQGKMYDNFAEEQRRTTWLTAESLQRLLYVANVTYETDFVLAYVLEGFRGSFVNNEWDPDWVYPIEVNSSLIPDDQLDRPVIFVWNNNAETKRRAHGGPRRVDDHWEGFEAPTNGNDKKSTLARRTRVLEWNMGQEIRDDIDKGVWRVDESCEGGGQYDLTVGQGHFVRAAVPPNHVNVPAGWSWM
jgi:hypothetical protein